MWLRVLAIALVLAACSGEDGLSSPTVEHAVIYGDDDRREFFQVSTELQNLSRSAIAAVVRSSSVRWSASQFALSAASFGEVRQLCAGETFSEQPAIAHCSSVLVDDDLVLTAGHCFRDEADCRSHRFVFSYFYQTIGGLAAITQGDVYSCRRILMRLPALEGSIADIDVVQLDRAVTGAHGPASIATSASFGEVGGLLTAIGFGAGLPLKVDEHAVVLEGERAAGDLFRVAGDAFVGASGMGLFNHNQELVGLVLEGEDDFVWTGDCYSARRLTDSCDGCAFGGELAAHPGRVRAALCASGWPSVRLCGRAPQCGDGYCNGSERDSSCSSDCDAPLCGDGTCDGSELIGDCPSDCANRTAVPIETADEGNPSEGCNLAKGMTGCPLLECRLLFALLILHASRRRRPPL